MTWIFICDRCGKKSLDDTGIPRRDGEYAATVTIKLGKARKEDAKVDDEHPESNELCACCQKNLYVWFDNLDVIIPRHSDTPPPVEEQPHGTT